MYEVRLEVTATCFVGCLKLGLSTFSCQMVFPSRKVCMGDLATTFAHPTYIEYGVVHYCVTNMPGGVARTSAFALNNARLPFVLALAGKGYKKALLEDSHLMQGLNIYRGRVTYEAVAQDLGYPYVDPKSLFSDQ